LLMPLTVPTTVCHYGIDSFTLCHLFWCSFDHSVDGGIAILILFITFLWPVLHCWWRWLLPFRYGILLFYCLFYLFMHCIIPLFLFGSTHLFWPVILHCWWHYIH
jgi:hypothetical protein